MKARLKFSKSGTMKFIGHLDLMRYFQKAFKRAEVPVSYSKGFSPHQLLSFASPLGVGLTSDGEYLDMQLETMEPSVVLLDKINRVMNEEIRVLNIKALPEDSKPSMALVAAADYLISVKDGYSFCDNYQKLFGEFMKQDKILIQKKTKKSEAEIDLKPYIYELAFHYERAQDTTADVYENGISVFLKVSAGSVVNIKPQLVMEAFCDYCKMEYNPYGYQVHRIELYGDISQEEGKMHLVPLSELGQEIV